MNEFEKWQAKWGEKKEILISIGIIPYGYDSGIAARINDVSVDLPDSLIEIICNLVKIKNDLLVACEGTLSDWHSKPNNFIRREPQYLGRVRAAIRKAKGE